MQSFHFHGTVNGEGRNRLQNILSHCPELIDLRLTSDMTLDYGRMENNEMDWNLHSTICSLRNLQRLHITGWFNNWGTKYADHSWKNVVPLKELVIIMGSMDTLFIQETIRKSLETLEVLVIYDGSTVPKALDIVPHWSTTENQKLFAKLTHLDLQLRLTEATLELLSSALPRLRLVHFGCGADTVSLIEHCYIASTIFLL
ncbi:hypothetical protein EC991_002919 [Linnemannia zychae]|nr:hypothetical protein EC991_002919 [Linnemannia zychae]